MVTLDNYVQPVDRGLSAAEAQRMLRSWQYAATGKHSAAAAALMELKAEHIKHGKLVAPPDLHAQYLPGEPQGAVCFVGARLFSLFISIGVALMCVIFTGGVMGVHAEASKLIVEHGLDDETFYVVDLGNVLRMYKVMPPRQWRTLMLAGKCMLHAACPLHSAGPPHLFRSSRKQGYSA